MISPSRGRFPSVNRITFALTCGLVFALPRTSMARPIFPAKVREVLELAREPICGTCHTGSPSRTTAKQPFARSLLAHADPPGRLPTALALDTALRALITEGVDSDGDGLPDADELQVDRDPNEADGTTLPEAPADAGADAGTSTTPPASKAGSGGTTGCGVGSFRGQLGIPAFVGFATAWVLLRRRRK